MEPDWFHKTQGNLFIHMLFNSPLEFSVYFPLTIYMAHEPSFTKTRGIKGGFLCFLWENQNFLTSKICRNWVNNTHKWPLHCRYGFSRNAGGIFKIKHNIQNISTTIIFPHDFVFILSNTLLWDLKTMSLFFPPALQRAINTLESREVL